MANQSRRRIFGMTCGQVAILGVLLLLTIAVITIGGLWLTQNNGLTIDFSLPTAPSPTVTDTPVPPATLGLPATWTATSTQTPSKTPTPTHTATASRTITPANVTGTPQASLTP
jgi:hypothetical protein